MIRHHFPSQYICFVHYSGILIVFFWFYLTEYIVLIKGCIFAKCSLIIKTTFSALQNIFEMKSFSLFEGVKSVRLISEY